VGIIRTSGWVWIRIRVSFLSASRRASRASTASAKRVSKSAARPIRVQLEQVPQKAGSPLAGVGGVRQFMAWAIITASVYFPAPAGPVRMTPWGKRSRASAFAHPANELRHFRGRKKRT